MEKKVMEDVCDTGLSLTLGSDGRSGISSGGHHRRRDSGFKFELFEPSSLTLGLSHDPTGSMKTKVMVPMEASLDLARQSSTHSTVSSFSNAYPTSTKKEVRGEEAEVERVSSRASDEEDEASARKKLRLTREQSALLEDKFKEHSTLNPKQKQALAKQLSLRPRQVEVWFQNRRARTKLKQTEVDCDFLKKCCETLTEENRRLQKEVQELKVIKFAAYMQLPAATLSICPSCERISGAEDCSKRGPFVPGVAAAAAGKPLFLNPFTHSAAC